MSNAQETDAHVANVVVRIEAFLQTNMLRNAWATWAVEDMLQKKKGINDSKPKSIFRRGLTAIRRRASKMKIPKKQALSQLDSSPVSVITAESQVDSLVNPFSEENSDNADVVDDTQGMADDVIAVQTEDSSKQKSSRNEEGHHQQALCDSEAGEDARKKRAGISGALRSKFKQRSDRKIQKNADKRVDEAMARAEKEKKKWLKQVEQEEKEEAAAATERQKAFMAKAASRSKKLMLQHLCAISIQSSWRSACARAQLNESKERASELQVSRPPLFDDNYLSEQESNPEVDRTEHLKAIDATKEQGSLTQYMHGPASP